MRGSYSALPLQALNVRVNSAFVGVGAAIGCVEYCAAKGCERGGSGLVSPGSTFFFHCPRAMEEEGVSLQPEPPLQSLLSFPSSPLPALVD